MSSESRAVEISVVVPFYLESAGAARFTEAVAKRLRGEAKSFEIVAIDDGSTDDTWEQLRRAAGSIPELRLFRLSRNFGKEAAIAAGLEHALGDAVVVMDGDFQHPPELLPALLSRWRQRDVDVVEAVKTSRGEESPARSFGAWLFFRSMRALAGVDLSGQSDFKLLDRRVLTAWLGFRERNLFFRGLVTWLGFRRATVSFEVSERRDGSSRFSPTALARLAITAVTSFSSGLLQLVTLAGLLFSIGAVALGVDTLVNWVRGSAVTGFTTVILLQLIIGSLLMLSLGIIGAYMATMFDEIKARPRYLIADAVDRTARGPETPTSPPSVTIENQ